jgi:hypothetical protein
MPVHRESKSELWTFVSDKTLYTYGILLRKFTYGVFSSCKKHSSGYSLPLSEDDKIRAAKLQAVLKSQSENDEDDDGDGVRICGSEVVDEFHRFIKPFLYPFAGASGSRWDDPLECFIALYALNEDGTFRSADGMTPPFAHFQYHMRCAMYYEAQLRVRESGGELDMER